MKQQKMAVREVTIARPWSANGVPHIVARPGVAICGVKLPPLAETGSRKNVPGNLCWRCRRLRFRVQP
jgi:hypothetical protein